MKKLLLALCVIGTLATTTSCENYSNGNRVGYVSQFSETGRMYKSWEGHLNMTQTGMNTAAGWDFSVDNDKPDELIVATLDSALKYGWKVELKYHEVSWLNWWNNRGHTDYFVTEVKVLDRGTTIPTTEIVISPKDNDTGIVEDLPTK